MKIIAGKYYMWLMLLSITSQIYSQMPSAIKITPENATGFQEITLTFYPDSACVPYGKQGLAGLDSIAMHSSAKLANDPPDIWWNHIVEYDRIGFDGTLPHLYPNPDGSYSITFTPSKFYGTGNATVIGIAAVFNDCFGWDKEGKDYDVSACKDFYIPLNSEKTSVTFNVNMSHQIFLGNLDPLFDFVDVAGTFNNWGIPTGTNLNDINDDGIYTVTIPDLIIGQTIEYKFRINNDWGSSEFAGGGANRVYLVQEGENILDHWYDDALPIKKTVTLIVNMNYQHEIDVFNPLLDNVDVAGTFNNWASEGLTLLSDLDGDLIYSVQISDLYVGQTIKYKFRLGSWDMGRHELPGPENDRIFKIAADTNVVYHWYNNENPELMPDLFFSEYLDGSGSNNALVITNRTGNPIDLYQYGIVYTNNGGAVNGPVKVSGPVNLNSNDSWLIINPSFNISAIEASAVDAAISSVTSFDGNDALALVKLYASETKYRVVDRIGLLSVNPGTGWDMAGIPNATRDKRLVRKATVNKGQPDWAKSAGTNPYNSEWIVLDPEIPPDLGTFIPSDNLDNQWHLQSSGIFPTLRSITVGNDGKGISVGDDGTVVSTLTNGQVWTPENVGTNQLYDAFFLPEGEGWMVGSKGTILHTTDGSAWQSQTFGAGNWLESVFFLDPLNGYAAGEYLILKTTDGGQTWNWLNVNNPDWFNNIFFTDRENGWVVGYTHVLYTRDGGQSWQKLQIDPELHFYNIFFFDNQNGWLSGHKGVLMRTTDGGNNWTRQFVEMDGTIRDICFITPDIGWIVGDAGKIFFTNDGGINWKPQYSGTDVMLNDIFFVTRNKGWIAGENGTILSTLDGWNNQITPSVSMLYSVFFTDERTGWTAGEQGTIIKTMSAGQMWDTIPKIHLTPWEPHYDIFFTDKNNGWIASSGGNIYHTNNGGVSWSVQPTGVPDWFQSVFFLNKDLGWAVAGGGKIAWTDDGGDNWHPITYGNKLYSDIFFIDENTGWISGEQGIILKSNDGGLTWNPQSTPGSPFIAAIYFSDENNGIAVGTDGYVLKTTNGGANWNSINSGTASHLHGLYFLDPLNGWACGDNGTIIHTYDGGGTWYPIPSGTDKSLTDIFFTDVTHGWAVGADGIIIQTSSGGCSDPFVNLPRDEQICLGDTIGIDAGPNPAYQWNTGEVVQIIKVSSEGFYSVTVSNYCNQESSDSIFLKVTDPPSFLFETDGPTTICDKNDVGIFVRLLNDDGISNYTYDWGSDAKDSSTVRINSPGFFPVTVSDRLGCMKKDSIKITVQYPYDDEEIGVVTFDLESGKNLVVWKKTPDKGTNLYNIYRVLANNVKEKIGSVNYNELTVFTDINSDPRKVSNTYVITVVDTCGNESFYSASHKTMHLTANKGTSDEVNLIWDNYEGIPFDYYYIYRGTDSTAMKMIDSIPNISNQTYTDVNPPAGRVYYQIGIKLPEPILLSTGKKAGSGPYSQSMSNLEDNRFLTGIDGSRLSDGFTISPNPFNDRTTLRFSNPNNHVFRLKILDLTGKTVLCTDHISGSEYILERNNLEKGYYILELAGDIIYRERIIIE